MIERLARVSLLRLLVGMSALVLGVGGLVLGSLVTGAFRDQAVDHAKDSLAQYVDGVLVNELAAGDEVLVKEYLPDTTMRELGNRADILTVKVWRADGVLAWTSREEERIGRRFPPRDHLNEALAGHSVAEFEDLGAREHKAELRAGIERALEIYVPLRSDSGSVIGAYEVYADASELESSTAARTREIWLAIGLVFLVLWVALALLSRRASHTLQTQTALLRERSAALAQSFEALERNSLDAVESLNATVEAKDPYTAGHSIRVQQMGLAIGHELGLMPEELDAVRWGALFHDIGKIAIPDAILLKPGRLTDAEFEQMKRHTIEGARIVGKLARLKHAVPVIRHHHERYDGKGYPDGLAMDDVPLPAAIVGIVDAWDAMTTDRPHAEALSNEAALNQIRRGRGNQFVPAVVDAFLRLHELDPADHHAVHEITA